MHLPDPPPSKSFISTKPSINAIAQNIKTEAGQSKGDPLALLSLLRVLEELHRSIRDDFFLDALPTNRQALYALLRDIEQHGGWPYIPRIKLRELLQGVEEFENGSDYSP